MVAGHTARLCFSPDDDFVLGSSSTHNAFIWQVLLLPSSVSLLLHRFLCLFGAARLRLMTRWMALVRVLSCS